MSGRSDPGRHTAGPRAGGACPGSSHVHRQPHRVRERAARHAAVRLGRELRATARHPGLRRSLQRQRRGFDQLQDPVGGEQLRRSTSTGWATTAETARAWSRASRPNISVSQNQPACNTNTVTGLVDCGNWGVSATWNVPTTAVSGVYFAHIYTAQTARRREPDPVRGDQQREHLEHRLHDLRRDLAGLQRLGRLQPVHRRLPRAALVLQRAGSGPRRPGQLQPALRRRASITTGRPGFLLLRWNSR